MARRQAVGQRGIVVLGTSVGHADFVQAWADAWLQERRLLDELPHLPDLPCAWLLLLFCASPRANHALRTLPPSESASHARARDQVGGRPTRRGGHDSLHTRSSGSEKPLTNRRLGSVPQLARCLRRRSAATTLRWRPPCGAACVYPCHSNCCGPSPEGTTPSPAGVVGSPSENRGAGLGAHSQRGGRI